MRALTLQRFLSLLTMTMSAYLIAQIEVKAAESTAASTTNQQTAVVVPAELAKMMDRMAIENLLADYYSHYGAGPFDYSQYYTDDGILNVDGQVSKGKREISALYASYTTDAQPKRDRNAVPVGKLSVQLTNLKVEVDGTNAKAEMFWNCLLADTVVATPKIIQYGKEHTELVKRDGRWLIKSRVTTSYGGMPSSYLTTYEVD